METCAPSPTAPLGFSGAWATDFNRLELEVSPHGVARGRYAHMDGRLEGLLEGQVLRGRWDQPGNHRAGDFELTLGEGCNTFSGQWRYDGDEAWRGAWNGVRLELPAPEQGGFPGGYGSRAEGPLLAGPMVGQVGEADARVWAQARGGAPLALVVQGDGGEEIRRVEAPAWSEWRCVTFRMDGLRPGARYTYAIEGEGGRVGPFPLRLAPARDAQRCRIAFGSCFWDYPNPALGIFDAIGREKSDAFVMLGDTAYMGALDWHTEHTMMLTHLRHRNNPALRRLLEVTPTLGLWDDHDFGPNDADGRFPGKAAALRAFRRMWANASYGTPDAPGVYSTARVGPAEMFLLDSRYYKRDPAGLLGAAQIEWLVGALLESDAPVKLIVSPTQVLPEMPVRQGWDSFRRDAPDELEALLQAIEVNELRGVVFVSGDLHMANLMHVPGRPVAGRRGPDFWELTTSPLANDPWRVPANGQDPYIIAEVADRVNFGVVDVDLGRAGSEILLLLKGEDGGTLIEQPLALSNLEIC